MARKLERYSLFIGGKWSPPLSGRYLPSYEPTSGEPWYELPDADSADVNLAVEAARSATPPGDA